MAVIAIIGAGPIGGALAHKVAGRSRVSEVRLIDSDASVAKGKALDIRQSGPIEGSSTSVTAGASILDATGADVIVIADAVPGFEHAGEAGLALVRQLLAAGASAPLIFAGGAQTELMSRCITELHASPARIIGSAPGALAAAVRALCGVVLDSSAAEIAVNVAGVPPKQVVVAWQEGSVAGTPLTDVMPAHEIAALVARLPGLWPPGPYALASAGARVAEALCSGSRRHYSCFVDVGRGRIAAMPVELKRGGVRRVIEPSLTAQERTTLENALSSNR